MQNLIPIVMLALGIMFLVSLVYFRNREKTLKAEEDDIGLRKLRLTRTMVYAGFGFFFMLLIIGGLIQSANGSGGFLKNLAATMVLGWLVLLVVYYAWAIYFYNINLGWSDDKWNRYRRKQKEGTAGDHPNRNPHSEETLGLPPGTVRGTIALTLLVVAIALVVGSLNEDTFLKPNSVLATHFDFLKDAFLMMIAFYFGAKSLDVLKGQPNAPEPVPVSGPVPPPPPSPGNPNDPPKLNAEQQKKIEPNFIVPGAEG